MGGFEGGDEGGYWDVGTLPQWMNQENESKSNRTKKVQPPIERSDAGYSIKAAASELPPPRPAWEGIRLVTTTLCV